MKPHRTRSQERVLDLLHSLHRPLSAQEIYVELRQRNQSIGLATVYRSLEALKLAGAVQVRTLSSGESLYDATHRDEHYLTCLSCGRSEPIQECPVGELEARLQQKHGFQVFYHSLEFFGLCDRCQPDKEQTGTVG